MQRYLIVLALMFLLNAPCLLQDTCSVDERQAVEQTPDPSAAVIEELRAGLKTCMNRVDGLEASIKDLTTKVQNPPELTTVWHFLGVYWFTGAVQGFSIPTTVVPETAREVLILCNIDSTGAGGHIIQGNMWTQRKDKKFNYFYSSYRNQDSKSWNTNSNYWWFPISGTDRTIYVNSANFVQAANLRTSDLGIGIVAYR